MEFWNVFEQFNNEGKLFFPEGAISFSQIPWSKHAEFEGVALKHIVTAKQTDGAFSYHLVRIAPNKKIGNHVHKEQVETHEIIAGTGYCIRQEEKLPYQAGTIAILPKEIPHEVTAGEEGLYLFAKFMPALV